MGDLSAGLAASELELSQRFTDLEQAIDRWLDCRTAPDSENSPQDLGNLEEKLKLLRAQIDMRCNRTVDRGFSNHTRGARVRKGIRQLMGIAARRAQILNS